MSVPQASSAALLLATTGVPGGLGPASIGSAAKAAPADHVHPFGAALQRKRVAATASTQWTFDTAFGVGVTPVIGCLVESPSSDPVFQEPQITSIDNTQVTIALRAQSSSLSVLSLGVVTLFAAAIPANTFLHLSARDPNA